MPRHAAKRAAVLRWGFDLHGTLLDTYQAIETNILLEQTMLNRELHPDELQALRDRVFTDEKFILEQVKPISGSIKSVFRLLDLKQNVSFVSRSDEKAHCASFHWLTGFNLGHLPHSYTGRGQLKHTIIHRGQFHVFVENNVREATPLCTIVPYVFLLDPSSGIDRPEPVSSLKPWNDSPIIIPGFACFSACITRIIERLAGQEEEVFLIRRSTPRSVRKAERSSPISSPESSPVSSPRPQRRTKLAV
jgi:hypothetical protein